MTTRKNIVVYTCIVNGYDDLLDPLCSSSDIEFYCISDRPVCSGSRWNYMPVSVRFRDPALTNRYAKMHPETYFPDFDISIYVDGNIRIVSSPVPLAQEAMKHASIALYQHFSRNCIYDEATECAAVGHGWFWNINAQMNRYRQSGYLADNGLFEGNVIIRRHNQHEVVSLMDLWWLEYLHGVRRDQLSLPYLIWKTSTEIYNLGMSDQRYDKMIFSLNLIHREQPFVTRIRGMINRKIMPFFSFK